MLAHMQKAGCTARAQRAGLAAPAVSAPARAPACLRQPKSGRGSSSVLARVAAGTAQGAMEEDQLVSGMDPEEQAEMLKLPKGYHWYETMLILTPVLNDEDRDRELAKFEAFLNKEECLSINALVRGRSRMAYPMKQHWEGIYVLYTYAARRQTARTIQLMLSNPEVGSEQVMLRHQTLCKY